MGVPSLSDLQRHRRYGKPILPPNGSSKNRYQLAIQSENHAEVIDI